MNIDSYEIIFTPTCINEIKQVYRYIDKHLYANKAAKILMRKIQNKVQSLKYAPEIHSKIEKYDSLKRTYRKIVVDNFVILYTVDKEKMIIYISHMYYVGMDYLNN